MRFKRSDTKQSVTFGQGGDNPKTVYPRKITVEQYLLLIDSIQTLPQLVVSVITANPADRMAYFVVALRESFDDIVRVTSILTGLDEDYVKANAALDELVEYYTAVVKVNNFGELLKNVQGALGTMMPTMATTQGAN